MSETKNPRPRALRWEAIGNPDDAHQAFRRAVWHAIEEGGKTGGASYGDMDVVFLLDTIQGSIILGAVDDIESDHEGYP